MKKARERLSHFLTLEVRSHEPKTKQEALNSVHAWLEINGYTSVGHGFDFVSVIGDRGRRIRNMRNKEK